MGDSTYTQARCRHLGPVHVGPAVGGSFSVTTAAARCANSASPPRMESSRSGLFPRQTASLSARSLRGARHRFQQSEEPTTRAGSDDEFSASQLSESLRVPCVSTAARMATSGNITHQMNCVQCLYPMIAV